MMSQSFYQQKPTVDTPYKQLELECANGWRVRLLGGTKWGRENAEELRVVKVQDFDAGVLEYNKIFGELREQGWKRARDISVGGDVFGFSEGVNRAYVIR